MLFMIAIVKDNKRHINGIRILNTDTRNIMDATYESVVDAIENNRATIENLRVEQGRLIGINGSINNYTDLSNKSNLNSRVILAKTPQGKFICSDYEGNMNVRSEWLLDGSRIANGEMVNGRIKREFKYPSSGALRSKLIRQLNDYTAKCKLMGIEPVKVELIDLDVIVRKPNKLISRCIIPKFATEIGAIAFKEQIELTKLVVPDNIKNIGKEAFEGCVALEQIKLHNGIESIGDMAFRRCNQLKEIKIPTRIKEIRTEAFQGCTSLEKIEIPTGVTLIGERAFYFCEKLKEVYLPDTIQKIGKAAFTCCFAVKVYVKSERVRQLVLISNKSIGENNVIVQE